ncbi:hypothetical protein [uncultured Fibrella sp.]|uniref:hypothetical protein n=1 Tax=uncultured Fibrella sp. TaxID=1284596 RepID=UPI0035C968DD
MSLKNEPTDTTSSHSTNGLKTSHNTASPDETAKKIYALGSEHVTEYGGVVSFNEDGVVEFINKYDEIIGLMSKPLEEKLLSEPFRIYVSSESNTHPSIFTSCHSVGKGSLVITENKTVETLKEMVGVGASMLGYDRNMHKYKVVFERDDYPLTDVVLFRYAAKAALGRPLQRTSQLNTGETLSS